MQLPPLLRCFNPAWYPANSMYKPLITITLLLTAAPVSVQAAEVYKWVDEQGRTHYGDKPADDSALSVDVESENPEVDPVLEERRRKRDKLLEQFADERRKAAEEAEKLAAEKAERERKCEQTRNRLWQYEHSPYLYETTENGERRILNDAERAAEENRLREFLEKNCQ